MSRVVNVGIDQFLVLGPVNNCKLCVVSNFILKNQVFEKLSLVSFCFIFNSLHPYLKVKFLLFCQSFFPLNIILILIELCTFGTRQF